MLNKALIICHYYDLRMTGFFWYIKVKQNVYSHVSMNARKERRVELLAIIDI